MKNKLEKIFTFVCEQLSVNPEQVVKRSRKEHLVFARQVYFYVAKTCIKSTLKQIAGYLSLDHSTVVHGIKRVEDLIYTEKKTRDQINEIVRSVNEWVNEKDVPGDIQHPIDEELNNYLNLII